MVKCQYLVTRLFSRKVRLIVINNIVLLIAVVGVSLWLTNSFKRVVLFDHQHPAAKILMPSTTSSLRAAIEHDKLLISILSQREAAYIGQNSARAGLIWQVRMFYAAILTILSSLILTKNGNKHPTKWILMFTIPLMYLAEVHLQDLEKRARASTYSAAAAINTLSNLNPNDSTWYSFSYARFADQQARFDMTHEVRKSINALHPDPIQVLFYGLPFLVLLLYLLNEPRSEPPQGTKNDGSMGCSSRQNE